MSIKILSSITDAYLSRLESAKNSSGSDKSTDSFADALEEAQETLASANLTDAEKNAVRAMAVDAAVTAIRESGGYGLTLDSALAESLGLSSLSTGQAEASSSVQVETAEEAAARITAASTAASASESASADEAQDADAAEETDAAEESAASSALTTADIKTYSVDASNLNCSDELLSYFKEAAETYNVDEKLLRSFAVVESNFDPSATSKSGAMGVMQLMPVAAEELGVDDPYDAYQSIMGGAKLISQLLEKYDGDLGLTAASYNAGSNAVANCGGIPSSTEAYVAKVLSYYYS